MKLDTIFFGAAVGFVFVMLFVAIMTSTGWATSPHRCMIYDRETGDLVGSYVCPDPSVTDDGPTRPGRGRM